MSRSGSHNFRKIRSVILTAMLSFVSLACMKTNLTAQTAVEADTPGLSDIEFTVTEASEWTALFKRNTGWIGDRKSTRLNSSHVAISYAVFCLKKKNKTINCPLRW